MYFYRGCYYNKAVDTQNAPEKECLFYMNPLLSSFALLVLDIKSASYFTRQGASNQHGGGGALFSHDADIMGWLFAQE